MITTKQLAFPVVVDLGDRVEWSEGMELRDWFAGLAMQGLQANPVRDMGTVDIADYSYRMADAMLKAREVGHD